VSRIAKDSLLALLCLAFVVPTALLAIGVLPYKLYVVHTGSMSPTIPSKSAVIVREGVYHLGQVITFESPNGVVTHRLIKRNADGTFVTKGDANRTVDPGSVSPSEVIGGVVMAPPMLGYWLAYLKNPAGLASLFATMICLWLIYSTTTGYAERQQRAEPRKGQKRSVNRVPAERIATTVVFDSQAVPKAGTAPTPTPSPILDGRARIGVEQGDEPDSSWELKPWETPVVFRCSYCKQSFFSHEELRHHAAGHDGRTQGERQQLRAASRFVGRAFTVGAPQPVGPSRERKAG
jgi:signal peptidase I